MSEQTCQFNPNPAMDGFVTKTRTCPAANASNNSSFRSSLSAPDTFRILTGDISLADVNTAQDLFTSGAFTAEATTSYAFDAFYHITRAAGTTLNIATGEGGV